MSSKTRAVLLAVTLVASISIMALQQSAKAQLQQPQMFQQQFYQLRQNFAMLEQQLSMAPPQQQQFMISNVQQQIMQMLAQSNPQSVPAEIQILQQAMSPQLAQVILPPILSQLNNGRGGLGSFPSNNHNINNGPLQSIAPPGLQSSPSFEEPGSSSPSYGNGGNKLGSNQFSSQLHDKSAEIQHDIDEWNKRKDKDFANSFNTFNNP
jgi:hypothetical protein